MDNQIALIDIDQILKSKLGSKARYVPGFVASWLKRIIHQDEINAFSLQEGDKQGVPWVVDCVNYLGMKFEVNGIENLPPADSSACYTFVSNHPLGGPDGIMLGSLIGRHYDERIKFLVNDFLMHLHGMAPLFVPINKTGRQNRDFPAMVKACFESDCHVIMFPAGLCSRRRNGKIRDLAWNKAFVTKSIETKRDVVPIHFGGRNSDFFYRLSGITDRLHLKFNPAMIFLVDELFKNKGKTFKITIGKPIPWQTFDKSKTPAQWAEHVKSIVYQMES